MRCPGYRGTRRAGGDLAGDLTGTGGGGFGGGLGSIGSVFESAESVERQIARVRELTKRPFAVNHVVPLLNEEAFEAILEAKPVVVLLALGDPGDLVERAHATGAKVVHQIHTVGKPAGSRNWASM